VEKGTKGERKDNPFYLCHYDGNATDGNGAVHPHDPALPHFISICNGLNIIALLIVV